MEKKTIWDLHRLSVEEYRRSEKLPVAVVVDNVRSLNNIGSLFRTCDCLAVEGIALCGISACPPSPEIHKTALGAEDSVSWTYYGSTLEAVKTLREAGYMICCLEQVKGSVSLDEFMPEPGRKIALVVGNEVDGVDPGVVDVADVCIEIPQFGTKHSLNVTVSAGIALWQLYVRIGIY